ncbi:phosphatidylglycerol lysyltransferase domain-containing protein [Lysinibacillus yapensis]|nr:phosphatidylglycerol lysyltransferase domain-containing protein [Lysinibacillus yapensis]
MIFIKNLISHFPIMHTQRGLLEQRVQVQDDLLSFLKNKGGNHVSHLFFLNDKEQFWTTDQTGLIVYKQIFNKFVVLGDPIGEEKAIQNAIKEFTAFCKKKRVKPVFYQVNPRYMHHYHDAGFRFAKLGEEAIVKLELFSLEGKRGAKLRTRVNKFTREGYAFSVAKPPHSSKFMAELKAISDSWLGTEKEKGFSVVSFQEEYVSRFPVALLHNSDGEIIAFATLTTDYKQTLIIDLMRKGQQSPHGAMDVLFANILTWAKEKGYQNCSLGMAPLANVGNCKESCMNEKLIHLVYLHGNQKYNFKGLETYKAKFATDWEPKYLAYKKSWLPLLLLQLVLLINHKHELGSSSKRSRIIKRKLRFG